MAAIEDLITEIERSYEELNEQLADPARLGLEAGVAAGHDPNACVSHLRRHPGHIA